MNSLKDYPCDDMSSPDGQKTEPTLKPLLYGYIVEVKYFRSEPGVNTPEDMARISIDIRRKDMDKLRRLISSAV